MMDIVSFHPYFCISFNMNFLKYKMMPLPNPTKFSYTESVKFHDCLKKKMSLHSCFCLDHDPVRIHTLLCLGSLNHLMHLFFHHCISLLMKRGHLSLVNFPHSIFQSCICCFSPHLECKLITGEGKYFIEFLLINKNGVLKYVLLLLQLLMK